MSSRLWLMTPCLAVAATVFLALSPGSAQRVAAAAAPAPCVRLASAEATDVMTDATPDACVYSVAEGAPATAPCHARTRTAVMVRAEAVAERKPSSTLEWPGDFVTLTADAAADVFRATVGLIGDVYDYAERKAVQLWV